MLDTLSLYDIGIQSMDEQQLAHVYGTISKRCSELGISPEELASYKPDNAGPASTNIEIKDLLKDKTNADEVVQRLHKFVQSAQSQNRKNKGKAPMRYIMALIYGNRLTQAPSGKMLVREFGISQRTATRYLDEYPTSNYTTEELDIALKEIYSDI